MNYKNMSWQPSPCFIKSNTFERSNYRKLESESRAAGWLRCLERRLITPGLPVRSPRGPGAAPPPHTHTARLKTT